MTESAKHLAALKRLHDDLDLFGFAERIDFRFKALKLGVREGGLRKKSTQS